MSARAEPAPLDAAALGGPTFVARAPRHRG